MQRGLMINELDHRYREDVYIFPMEAMELEALQLAMLTVTETIADSVILDTLTLAIRNYPVL